jgi:hypothetical protein
MRRGLFFLLILIVLMPMATGFAQNPVTAIDSLAVDLWPDYDKASVLVLLTGTLPGDTQLPASVTLPLLEAAQINAVARIDSNDGRMKDDILYSLGPAGTLTFTTPDSRFRLEYYFPYTVNNDRRSFDFTWLAAIAVNNFQLRVQQPKSASLLNTEPATVNVIKDGDGFDYHTFSARAVPAGQPFLLHVDYKMTIAQLSVESLPPPKTVEQTPNLPATATPGSRSNLAIVAIVIGTLIIIIVLVWQIASRRPSPTIPKPSDTEVEKQSWAKFCRNCGEPLDEGDNFCGECGRDL